MLSFPAGSEVFCYSLYLHAYFAFTSEGISDVSTQPSLLDNAISRWYCLFIQVEIERWNLEQLIKKTKRNIH